MPDAATSFLQVELRSVELYIVDFGDAKVIDGEARGKVGANCYQAPEVTLGTRFRIPAITFTFDGDTIVARLALDRCRGCFFNWLRSR